jgi:hypothetical protein
LAHGIGRRDGVAMIVIAVVSIVCIVLGNDLTELVSSRKRMRKSLRG